MEYWGGFCGALVKRTQLVTPETMPCVTGQRNLFEKLSCWWLLKIRREICQENPAQHLRVWPRRLLGGPPDHWCLVTNCWTLVSVQRLHVRRTHTVLASSVKVSGGLTTYLPTSTYKSPLVFGGDPCEGVWRPLGCLLALAPGLWHTIPAHLFTDIVYYAAVLVYWYSVIYYCTGMLV